MSFSVRLVEWFHQFGRKKLPWQKVLMPYPVWVSEIMLQQTQVKTVIPYFERFMTRYPCLENLANASLDEVLQLWAGLGYYARARNLHRSAQWMVFENQGQFPLTLTELAALPGLGRSTASAILAICFGQSLPILDGNVKRVLARYCGIEGYPGEKKIEACLWKEAEALLPSSEIPAYTQAIMDLGALICLPNHPHCEICPVSETCIAKQENRVADLPYPKPKQSIPTKEAYFALFICRDKIWLSPRPQKGIWGGLWCLPEYPHQEALESVLTEMKADKIEYLMPLSHVFTHYRLLFTPVRISLETEFCRDKIGRWLSFSELEAYGLPAPIKRLLSSSFPAKIPT